MTELGPISSVSAGAWGINNSGQVVGTSDIANGHAHAFLWQDGVMTDLGTLGGDTSQGGSINNHGQIVGAADLANGTSHAFLWQNGVMTDLGTLGGDNGFATDINDEGQIVGYSELATGETHAFLWQDGIMTDIGTLGGDNSNAVEINENGQIVGSSDLPYAQTHVYGESHAFLWQHGTMVDLGTLGGGNSAAYGINDSGQIVGQAQPSSDDWFHAFRWENGIMTDLGTLGGPYSGATGINDSGQIVGGSDQTVGTNGPSHLFLWQNGVMIDLGTFGGKFNFAAGINDVGQIVGQTYGDWHYRAFLANPAQPTTIAYYALGDSIASGHGLMDDYPDPCERSQDSSYPAVVANKLRADFDTVNFSLLACSGASFNHTAAQTTACQAETPSAYDQNCDLQQVNNQFAALRDALNTQQQEHPGMPTLVTVTVGIDDVGWTDTSFVLKLMGMTDNDFQTYMDNLTQQTADILRPQVDSLLTEYPNVNVVITGYYNPFNQQSRILQGAYALLLLQGHGSTSSQNSSLPNSKGLNRILHGLSLFLNRFPIYNPSNIYCTNVVSGSHQLSCYERTQQAIQYFNTSLVTVVAHEQSTFPTRIAFASVDQAFQGHESPQPLCGSAPPSTADTWIQYPSEDDINSRIPTQEQILLYPAQYGDCFHPNYAGANAYAQIVYDAATTLGY
jgi:probable HAF family extracellular repeat protein